MGVKLIDLMGQQFGRLTVVLRAENNKWRQSMWVCECECGGKSIVLGKDLRRGVTNSCGCLHKKAITSHGMSRTSTYKSWINMKSRCSNQNIPAYENYGGRGITVCDRWLEFEGFYEDMGNKPRGLTLERRDNNKGYSPENCYYATPKAQSRNTRWNRLIEYDGKTKCLASWAELFGISQKTLWARLERHSLDTAFNM